MFIRAGFLTAAIAIGMLAAGCATDETPKTPTDAFKTYITAVKKKDTTKMKLLLSADSIKMHEQEAKAQNVTLDDVVKRETLFAEGQREMTIRNEKVDGDKATLEVKNTFGSWETIPFVREDGEWKIDKKAYAERINQDVQQGLDEMDNFINQGKEPPSQQ